MAKTTEAKAGIEREIITLEHQFWQALKDNNVEAAIRLTDDPSFLTGAQGVMAVDHQAFRSMMATPNYTLHRYQFQGDPLVRLLSDDVAIIAYQVHEELTVEGKPVTLDAHDSSTWVRRGGRWVCALHTEAIKGDPYGRH